MAYRVRGLAPDEFTPLFGLSDAELAKRGAARVVVDAKPGAPCRITLDDAEIGETVILLSYEHQPARTPYRQQGPIFVRYSGAPYDAPQLGPALLRRTLSLRGFDARGMMIDADVVKGAEAEPVIARLFANPDVAYIHAHYASRGCYAARIDRA